MNFQSLYLHIIVFKNIIRENHLYKNVRDTRTVQGTFFLNTEHTLDARKTPGKRKGRKYMHKTRKGEGGQREGREMEIPPICGGQQLLSYLYLYLTPVGVINTCRITKLIIAVYIVYPINQAVANNIHVYGDQVLTVKI